MGDASEEISRLYEDPANLPIPIALMYAVAASIFNGVSATALQNELAELRGTAQHPRHDLFD